MRNLRNFTLLELMTVLAVLMVLTAIAIPTFYDTQLMSKRAEVKAMLSGMATSQMAYHADFGSFAEGNEFHPPPWPPGKTAAEWDDGAIPLQFDDIGFRPDGDVYGKYRMLEVNLSGTWYIVLSGVTDLDADGLPYWEDWQMPRARVDQGWTRVFPLGCETCY